MNKSHIDAITEKLKTEKGLKHRIGFAFGLTLALFLALSLNALILLSLFMVFGIQVSFWQCLFLAAVINYFVKN